MGDTKCMYVGYFVDKCVKYTVGPDDMSVPHLCTDLTNPARFRIAEIALQLGKKAQKNTPLAKLIS